MGDFRIAPSVVVGVDGSRASIQAALWAVDEAVSRDVPLRLVDVIDPVDLPGVAADDTQFASARAVLRDAQRAVEATGEPVKIETEVLVGKPLAKLAEESRCAVMICIGSIGIEHTCRGAGSVAAALPGVAQCPVAVIRAPQHRGAPPRRKARSIVAEVDNGVVLRHAFEEARLRAAPLRAAAAVTDVADRNGLAQPHVNRRIAQWKRRYPEVDVEPIIVRGSLCRYLAKNAESVEVFVTGARGSRCDLVGPGPVECSVLTVHSSHL